MIAYFGSPYSKIENKHELMQIVAKHSGRWMMSNPGWFAVTGLIHHYATLECPGLGTDYAFWESWCKEFMQKCDKLVILKIDGWESSVGVLAEIAFANELGMPVEYLSIDEQ